MVKKTTKPKADKTPAKKAAQDAGAGRSRRRASARHEYSWRSKWLTADTKTIDDMITSLQGAADELREMRDAGVVLDRDGGLEDDYAMLVTRDREVAARFGFETA